MSTAWIMINLVLVAFVAHEVWTFVGRFRRLKQDLLRGDTAARSRLYSRAIAFQWTSAALALLALRHDAAAFRPDASALGLSPLVDSIARSPDSMRGGMTGMILGLAMGTIAFVLLQRRASRRQAPALASAPWWRRLMPDFASLLPTTMSERLLWVVVSISAGVCEEIVFRGWLLSVLHDPLGLHGTWLIAVAAIVFGLAHAYQGVTGVILATVGGLLFCNLYVITGGLLVPILLHVAIDARFALVPAPKMPTRPRQPIDTSGSLTSPRLV